MKHIFTLNLGSSTVKMDLYDLNLKLLASQNYLHHNQWDKLQQKIQRFLKNLDLETTIVCHRVVHGGDKLKSTTRISKATLTALKKLIPLAPLHQPFNIQGIEILDQLGAKTQYAFFDTAAFSNLAPEKYQILIQKSTSKIRKYGFHGLNHAYLLQSMQAKLKQKAINGVQIHLGNGCSLTQVVQGQITDTSMSYTPLAGVAMFSRPGDLDPGIVLELCEKHGVPKASQILNQKSGLKSLQSKAKNIKEIFQNRHKNSQAALAIKIWQNSIAKYLSYYVATQTHIDYLVFSGGVSENNPVIIREILAKLPLIKNLLPQARTIPSNESLYMASNIQNLI